MIALEGPTRTLLTGERTALNFLFGYLSGIATMAARAVRALAGSGEWRSSTRARRPRACECSRRRRCATGGAVNHRSGLYDAILIKDNHIAARGRHHEGGATGARQHAPELAGTLKVEVQQRRAEIDEALAAGAPRAPCCSTT